MTIPSLVSTLLAGPLTNPTCDSCDNSSSDLPFVSGIKSVENTPVTMKNANISNLWKLKKCSLVQGKMCNRKKKRTKKLTYDQ
jgi:hypothetical protein